MCVCVWSYCCQGVVFGQLYLSRCFIFRQGGYIFVVCVCVVLLLSRCVVFGQLYLSRCFVFRQGATFLWCVCVWSYCCQSSLGRGATFLWCVCVCVVLLLSRCVVFGQLYLSRCFVFRQGAGATFLWCVCVCVVLLLSRCVIFGQLYLSRCFVFRQGDYIFVMYVCVRVCVCGPTVVKMYRLWATLPVRLYALLLHPAEKHFQCSLHILLGRISSMRLR